MKQSPEARRAAGPATRPRSSLRASRLHAPDHERSQVAHRHHVIASSSESLTRKRSSSPTAKHREAHRVELQIREQRLVGLDFSCVLELGPQDPRISASTSALRSSRSAEPGEEAGTAGKSVCIGLSERGLLGADPHAQQRGVGGREDDRVR